MKYCPNCGEPLEDNALFCPECGEKAPEAPVSPAPAAVPEAAAPEVQPAAPVPAAPVPEKKKSSVGKKIGVIAAIVLGVLLIAAAVLYFTGAYRSLIPDPRMKLGLAEKALVEKKLDEAFKYAPETGDMKASVSVRGSIEDDGTIGIFDELTYYKLMLEKASASVDLDIAEDHSNISAELGYAGSPLLSAVVTSENGVSGVYIPQLDPNYYTITDKALAELLASEGGSSVDLSALDLTPFDEAKTRRETLELLEIFAGLSTSENTVINKDVPVTLFGGARAASATEFVITPSPEEVKAVLNAAADKLESEDSYLGKKLGGMYGAVTAYTMFSVDDAQTLPEAIRRLAEEYPEDGKLVLNIYMDGEEIISQRVTYNDDTAGYDHELTETADHTLFFSGSGSDRSTVDIVRNTDVPDTDEAGTVTVTPSDGSKTVAVYHFDMTKRTPIGSYAGNISVKVDGQEILSCVIDDNEAHTHNIRITPPDGEGDGITAVNLIAEVSEGEGVKAPSVSPVDLSGKSAEEISEIFQNMLNQLSSVILSGLLGGFGF